MTHADLEAFAGLNPSFEADSGLLVLRLDHGKANEMGSEQLAALEALCARVETDDAIRCVFTTSERRSKKGTPIFISGANVTERTGWSVEQVKAHVRRQRELMRRLRALPVFTIAASHGVTLGWGVEYLLTTDYALATPDASFGLPETGLGIIPGARGSAELSDRVGPAHAMRLGATGERIDAAEALRIGLVEEMVDDLDAALSRARALAARLVNNSPTAVAAFKHASLASRGLEEAERLEIEARAYELCVDGGDASVGRQAFQEIREGRSPAWPTRRLLSPTSPPEGN